MSYEIHITIPENSPRGHLIASLTSGQHITPNEAVEKIIDQAARGQFEPPGQEKPVELVEGLRAHKKARGASVKPPKNPKNVEAIFGFMAGNEQFREAIDAIIASRARRYGFEE